MSDFPFNDRKSSSIESRRFSEEALQAADIRAGRLKKDKSRYSNTTEGQISAWDSLSGKSRNWRPSVVLLSLAAVLMICGFTVVIGAALRSGKPLQSEIERVAVPQVPKISANDEQKLRNTLAKAREAMDAFYSANTHEGRLPYIRDHERVGPLLEKFYQHERLGKFRPIKFGTLMAYRALRPESRTSIVFTWAILLDGNRRIVAVEESPNGDVKIDWECLVGYSSMDWPEFKSQRPNQTQVFRVIVTNDRNNPNPILDGDYATFYLEDVSRTYSMHGYARAGTISEKALTHQLAGFPETFVVVDLLFPEDAVDGEHVEIVNIRSMNWVEGFGPQTSFEPKQFLFFENE